MANGDIQEQINSFMEKLGKSKVPKKASGEAIVSGKPEKKESLIPTFKDIGISGFTTVDKNGYLYGTLVKLTQIVEELVIPVYASEMSPSLKLMAFVFANTKWATQWDALTNNGLKMPLFQACVELGLKLDVWDQSKDWEKIKKHIDIQASEQNEKIKQQLATKKADQEVIDKAIIDGEEWVPKEPEPVELTDYAKEIAGYQHFLEQLVEYAGIAEEAYASESPPIPVPNQPISLYKVKGLWKANIVPMAKVELKGYEKELAAIQEEKKPGNLVLTLPVKISSPGGNEMAAPPTFIPLPAGLVSINQFIWTIPAEVSEDTECQVLVGYGAEGYFMKGTLASASKAPPFKLDKGGVLKVSLLTTQPMDAWLELELEVEHPLFVPLAQLEKMVSTALVDWKQEELEKPDDQAEHKLAHGIESKTFEEFDPIPEGGTELVGFIKSKKEKPKGYNPKITALNIGGKAVDAKELADMLRSHFKSSSFTHYMIMGLDHEYKKTKGILMHCKITWAGDPEVNLIKWAVNNVNKAKTISLHYKVGKPIPLMEALGYLAAKIKH